MNARLLPQSFWAPLYFEPLRGSDERFCVAVIVVSASRARVVSAPGLARLRCLFSRETDFYISVVEEVARQLETFCESLSTRMAILETRTLDPWRFPTRGFSCGEFRFAKGENLELIAHNALQLCSSLATPLSSPSPQVRADRVVSSVRKLVTASYPQLRPCFNRSEPVYPNAGETHFAFISGSLAANMGRLNPGNLNEHFPLLQAKAMDLERLRDKQRPDVLGQTIQTFSLLALISGKDEPDERKRSEREVRVQETLNALSDITRARELNFTHSSDVEQLSLALIQNVALDSRSAL